MARQIGNFVPASLLEGLLSEYPPHSLYVGHPWATGASAGSLDLLDVSGNGRGQP
jgi:hypothetical protein